MSLLIKVPSHLRFDHLRIALTSDGVQFDAAVIEALCDANRLDAAAVVSDANKLVGLIVAWYTQDRAEGGLRRLEVERLVCGTGATVDQFDVC